MVPIKELKFLEEITTWPDFKNGQINHTYITCKEDKKVIFIGHIPRGTTTVHMWSRPMKVERTGRKFKTVATPYFAEEQIYGNNAAVV